MRFLQRYRPQGAVLALNGTYVACSYIFKSVIQDERQGPSGLSDPPAAECGIPQRTWHGTGLVTKVCSTDITCHRQQAGGQFLTDPHVPYDNNASERGVRKIKIKQKVSGWFWTDGGADDFAKLHSIAETAMKNGNSKFDAIPVVVNQ